MNEADDNTGTPPVAQQTRTEPASTKMLSQEEVNRIVERRVRETKDELQRLQAELEAAKSSSPTQTKPAASSNGASADIAEQIQKAIQASLTPIAEQLGSVTEHIQSTKQEQKAKAIDAALAGYDPNQHDLMRMWLADKPVADYATELEKKFSVFKLAPGETQTTPAAPRQPMPGGAPTGAQKDFSGVVDPATLTRDDVAHLQSQGKYLEVLEKWRMRGQAPQLFGRRTPK